MGTTFLSTPGILRKPLICIELSVASSYALVSFMHGSPLYHAREYPLNQMRSASMFAKSSSGLLWDGISSVHVP